MNAIKIILLFIKLFSFSVFLFLSPMGYSHSYEVLIKINNDKEKYEKHKKEGDLHLKNKAFLEAKSSYEKALEAKPGDSYAKEKIVFCQAALKKQYNVVIKRADEAFNAGNLTKSQTLYNEALAIIPDDEYAKKKLAETNGDTSNSFFKEYGGAGYDDGKSVLKIKDGYLVAGIVAGGATGNSDISIVKLDINGQLVWTKNFGGDESEEAYDLIATKDGNFLVVGASESFVGDSGLKDFWVVKFDPNGNKIWANNYGSGNSFDEAHAVVESEQGYLIVGNTTSLDGEVAHTNISAIMLGTNGSMKWQKKFGGESNEEAWGVVVTANGFTIVGNTESFGAGKWDIWLLNIDKAGNKVWDQTYGGGDNEKGNSLIQTDDNGYLIAGYTYTFSKGSLDAWVIKVDEKGVKQWDKPLGGESTDEAMSVIKVASGGYLAVGYSEVFEVDKNQNVISTEGLNAYFIRLKDDGEIEWIRSVGGQLEQRLFDVVEAHGGGFLAVGLSSTENKGTDILVIKINKSGNVDLH